MNDEEYDLLKLGPKFIFNDPRTAARRRVIELATLKRKLQHQFFKKKVSPGRPVDQFIAELDILLQNLHEVPQSVPRHVFQLQQSESKHIRPSKKNYPRLVKRLKHKFRLNNLILQKTDKSKVFHIGKSEDYQRKSKEYMEKTQAYRCLGTKDPLPSLIERTNKYLLELRLAKWITQKQYEQLSIDRNNVELAHLYYLPKAHKIGTPLRPIISGLRHPTIKISKYLDNLLRPLFNQMAARTTIDSGFELLKKVNLWAETNLRKETILYTIDVVDLYTMIPQVEGVLSLKKMLDYLNLKQIGGLKIETIIRLSRFVMQNNYFSFDGQYYHQIRGGAMGSPLTLTIANCYMFFFERDIVKQVQNSFGLYFRYIDDLFLVINWPERHLRKQIERWNNFDSNIKLNDHIGFSNHFLDLDMENEEGLLITKVYYKPAHEPYYLPFNSIHPLQMKKNIPFTMLLRGIRYCSTFELFIKERESLRMALLLNKYPSQLIDSQFIEVLQKFNIREQLNKDNYLFIRSNIVSSPDKEKKQMEYEKSIFIHFTYCSNMKTFPRQFHILWNKYFDNSPLSDVQPILGARNVANLNRHFN